MVGAVALRGLMDDIGCVNVVPVRESVVTWKLLTAQLVLLVVMGIWF